jgi:tetratricopeptide (TPR) repeat protein
MNAVLLGAGLLAMAPAASAAGATRRQFDRAVAAVQNSPKNVAMRERVIELSKELRPAPALPPEAKRRLQAGLVTAARATLDEDYLLAAAEFEAASVAAPWWGDPYHHLGEVYEKAGRPAQALAALRLALAVDPEDKDVLALLQRVERRGGEVSGAPASPLAGRWSVGEPPAEWRAAPRADGSVEFRLGPQRFVLRQDGAALSGSHLWDGREAQGRRRCAAQSSAATGTVAADGSTLTVAYRSPLRGCEPVDRTLELKKLE